MDISIEGATVMIDAALAASDALNKGLYDVRQSEPEAVFLAYREVVADIVLSLTNDVINPVLVKYPELKPVRWR